MAMPGCPVEMGASTEMDQGLREVEEGLAEVLAEIEGEL